MINSILSGAGRRATLLLLCAGIIITGDDHHHQHHYLLCAHSSLTLLLLPILQQTSGDVDSSLFLPSLHSIAFKFPLQRLDHHFPSSSVVFPSRDSLLRHVEEHWFLARPAIDNRQFTPFTGLYFDRFLCNGLSIAESSLCRSSAVLSAIVCPPLFDRGTKAHFHGHRYDESRSRSLDASCQCTVRHVSRGHGGGRNSEQSTSK